MKKSICVNRRESAVNFLLFLVDCRLGKRDFLSVLCVSAVKFFKSFYLCPSAVKFLKNYQEDALRLALCSQFSSPSSIIGSSPWLIADS